MDAGWHSLKCLFSVLNARGQERERVEEGVAEKEGWSRKTRQRETDTSSRQRSENKRGRLTALIGCMRWLVFFRC